MWLLATYNFYYILQFTVLSTLTFYDENMTVILKVTMEFD